MARRTREQHLLDRRTLIVWTSLIVSLSLACGLLLALNPVPHAPAVGRVLTVLDPTPDDLQNLLSIGEAPQPGRWKGIVIHHSQSRHGSAESLGRLHQSQGFGGLGFHFVIGNGDGAYDGEVQTGYRWARQLDGIHTAEAIAICLVGHFDQSEPTRDQMRQLVRLVTELQRQLNIPAGRVYLHRDLAQTTSPGLRFPAARFRQQLLDGPGAAP
jgi:hypothetical protein